MCEVTPAIDAISSNSIATSATSFEVETPTTPSAVEWLGYKKRQRFQSDVVISAITVLCMGIVFGVSLNKGQVYLPDVLRDSFLFRRFIMLKMFLSASSTSLLCFAFLSYFDPAAFESVRSEHRGVNNLWMTGVGSLMLGIGMVFSGSCPGMVLVQVGANVRYSYITFGGGLVGAFVFGLLDMKLSTFEFVSKSWWPDFADSLISGRTEENDLSLAGGQRRTYMMIAIFFSVVMAIPVIVMEIVFPWKTELGFPLSYLDETCAKSFLSCAAWPPWIAGPLIGFLQIPATILLGTGIGGSSSYVTVTAQWLRCVDEKIACTFGHFCGRLNYWWQLFYVVCAMAGSFLASSVTSFPPSAAPGLTPMQAFMGGFVSVFGSRLAKGCTSGHGITGMGVLTVGSMLAVGGMFAGGIAFAFLFFG